MKTLAVTFLMLSSVVTLSATPLVQDPQPEPVARPAEVALTRLLELQDPVPAPAPAARRQQSQEELQRLRDELAAQVAELRAELEAVRAQLHEERARQGEHAQHQELERHQEQARLHHELRAAAGQYEQLRALDEHRKALELFHAAQAEAERGQADAEAHAHAKALKLLRKGDAAAAQDEYQRALALAEMALADKAVLGERLRDFRGAYGATAPGTTPVPPTPPTPPTPPAAPDCPDPAADPLLALRPGAAAPLAALEQLRALGYVATPRAAAPAAEARRGSEAQMLELLSAMHHELKRLNEQVAALSARLDQHLGQPSAPPSRHSAEWAR